MSFEQYNDQPKEENKTQENSQEPTTENQTSFESTNTEPEKTTEGQGEQENAPKYGTDIDKLNKRLQDKDAFIEQLLNERKQDRDKFQRYDDMLGQFEEKLSVFESSNDILEKLRSQDRKKEDTDPVENNQNTDPQQEEPRLDPEYLRQQGFLTRDDLEADRKAQQREENLRQVTEKLAAKFGDKIDENVRRLAEDTDMTFEEAFELASNKPRAFERLFIGTGKSEKSSNTGFNSSVNTANFQHNEDRKVDYMNMSTEDRIRHNMAKLEAMAGNQS